MKNSPLVFFFLVALPTAHAQSEHVKLYLQQIAANSVWIEHIRTGTRIAEAGLNTISEIKNGDFTGHSIFFQARKHANPKITKMAKVTDLIVLQTSLLKECQNKFKTVKNGELFTAKEIVYIESVLGKLLKAAIQNVDELLILLTDQQYQMTDDERIQRINGLYDNTLAEAKFFKHFANEMTLLAKNRQKEIGELENMKKMYE